MRRKKNAGRERAVTAIALLTLVASILVIISSYGNLSKADPDITPPTIENVTQSSITSASAMISWDTNEPATSVIMFGTQSGTYEFQESDLGYTTHHELTLTGLAPSTTHYYVVSSMDEAGNSNTSSEYTFLTEQDAQPPQWSGMTTNPAQTTQYEPSAEYEFIVTWTDDAIDSVLFEHDATGTLQQSAPTATDGDSHALSLTGLKAGAYQWKSIANDTSGNSNETPNTTLTVNKAAPVMSLLLNGNEADITVNEGSHVNITATLDQAEGQIALFVDGLPVAQGNMVEHTVIYDNASIHNVTIIYDETENYTSLHSSHVISVQPQQFEITQASQQYAIAERASYTVSGTDGSTIHVDICGPIPAGGGFVACNAQPVLQNADLPQTIQNPYTNRSGAYIISGISSLNGANRTSSANYTVQNSMSLGITGDTEEATGEHVQLTATATGGIAPYMYNWTLSNGSVMQAQSIDLRYGSTGSYPVVAYSRDAAGNTAAASTTITIRNKHSLEVYVLEEDGMPIEGARVKAGSASETTDSDGYAMLEIYAGNYTVRASASGYNSSEQDINLREDISITMRLARRDDFVQSGSSSSQLALVRPSNNERITQKKVTLEARVNMEKSLSCSIFLAESGIDFLEEIQTQSLTNGGGISKEVELGNGNYKWNVECSSGQARYRSSTYYFTIDFDEEQEEKIISAGDVRDRIDEAIRNFEALDIDAKKAADALQMPATLERALRDYDRTIRDVNNIRFRSDLNDDQKKEKLDEYLANLRVLEKTTPYNLEVENVESFISYPKKETLEQIGKEYGETAKLAGNLDADSLNELQNSVIVKTTATIATMTMLDAEERAITIVQKEITYTAGSPEKSYMIEYIPKEVEDSAKRIVMVTEGEVAREDPILKYGKPEAIVYYFDSSKDSESLKSTVTLLFSDSLFTSRKQSSLTANIALGDIELTTTNGMLILLVIILAAYLMHAFGAFEKMAGPFSGKKREKQIIMLINDSKDYVSVGDMQKANLVFKEVKMMYERASLKIKRDVYDDAIKVCNDINSRFFEDLMAKTEEAIRAENQDSVKLLYPELMRCYSLLPDDMKKAYTERVGFIFRTIENRFQQAIKAETK